MGILLRVGFLATVSSASLLGSAPSYAHSYETCYEAAATACFNSGGTVPDCAAQASGKCRNHRHGGAGSADPASEDFAAPTRPKFDGGKAGELRAVPR